MTQSIYNSISEATTNTFTGNRWYDNSEINKDLTEAVKNGWCLRISHTQCEWTEKGVEEARRNGLTEIEQLATIATDSLTSGTAFDLYHDEDFNSRLRSAKYNGFSTEVKAIKDLLKGAARIEKMRDIDPLQSDKYEVGAILVDHWGYEQTNIEFYVIVKRTKTTVTILPMEKGTDYDGFKMEGKNTPGEIKWEEKPMRKKIQIHDGKENGFTMRNYSGGGWVTTWRGNVITSTHYA